MFEHFADAGLPSGSTGLEMGDNVGRQAQGHLLFGLVANRRATRFGQRAGGLANEVTAD